jgi:hypothetical protein
LNLTELLSRHRKVLFIGGMSAISTEQHRL